MGDSLSKEPAEGYPVGMLREDKKKEMIKGLEPGEKTVMAGMDWEYGERRGEPVYMPVYMEFETGVPASLDIIVQRRYAELNAGVRPPRDAIYMLQRNISEHALRHMPKSLRSKNFNFTNVELPKYFPSDQTWVLRNLTTHEFVRSEVVAGNSEQKGPYFEDIGFEHIVISRVIWSSTPWNATFNGNGLKRGVWAGHLLEITTFDHHQRSLLSDVAWKM